MRNLRRLALALLVATPWLVGGCGGGQKTTAESRKLVVVGMDSADWALWRPMLDEGRLPNLKAFMAQAASGRMQTFIPLEKSPLLWASICTGVRPEVHGVCNFVKGADEEPVTGSAWHAPAIWDILGAAGLSTSVVGMWTTYPARPIDGVMVSDYLAYGRERARPLANLASPDSLSAVVAAMAVDPASLGAAELGRFVDGDFDSLAVKYPEEIFRLREIHAADLGYLAVSRMLARTRDDDLFFFYLRGTDMISHNFYQYHKPDNLSVAPDPGKLAAFGETVPKYYDWADEVLGEVLSWFPPDRQAVIVSDHGFYGPRLSHRKGVSEHSEWGVFLVRSPLYTPGADFGKLQLLDICPTLLALMNLPPAKDMPGKILDRSLTDLGRKRVPALESRRVDSYMALRPAAGPEGERDPQVDEAIRRQLRSLGYIK